MDFFQEHYTQVSDIYQFPTSASVHDFVHLHYTVLLPNVQIASSR